jgi:hypothetical protein
MLFWKLNTSGRVCSRRYRNYRQVHPGQICARPSGLPGSSGDNAAAPDRRHPCLFRMGIYLPPIDLCPGGRLLPGSALGCLPARTSAGGDQQGGSLGLRLSRLRLFRCIPFLRRDPGRQRLRGRRFAGMQRLISILPSGTRRRASHLLPCSELHGRLLGIYCRLCPGSQVPSRFHE